MLPFACAWTRSGQRWMPRTSGHRPSGSRRHQVTTWWSFDAKQGDKLSADLTLLQVTSDMRLKVKLRLDKTAAEVAVALSSDGDLPQPLLFPYPFSPQKGSHLIIPL